MKVRFFGLILSIALLINIYGCVPVIVGAAAGVTGAAAISRDTVQVDTDKSFDRLWESAVMVARSRGTVKKENKASGYLYFTELSANIYVQLIHLTRSSVRMKVSARKYHFPDLQLAQDVFVKIMDGAS